MTIVAERYFQRGGTAPGSLPPAGRADIRSRRPRSRTLSAEQKRWHDPQADRDCDSAVPPSGIPTNGLLTLSWPAISNRVYRVEYTSSLSETNWSALPGDITATNSPPHNRSVSEPNAFIGVAIAVIAVRGLRLRPAKAHWLCCFPDRTRNPRVRGCRSATSPASSLLAVCDRRIQINRRPQPTFGPFDVGSSKLNVECSMFPQL